MQQILSQTEGIDALVILNAYYARWSRKSSQVFRSLKNWTPYFHQDQRSHVLAWFVRRENCHFLTPSVNLRVHHAILFTGPHSKN